MEIPVHKSDSKSIETDRSLFVNVIAFLFLGPASLMLKTVENVSFGSRIVALSYIPSNILAFLIQILDQEII